MADVNIIQYDFSHGELSPKMISRADLEIYRKSAKTLRNVLIIPQGGVKRRFGTEYITRQETSNLNAIQGTEYKYSLTKRFLVLFFDQEIKIYLDNVLKKTISSTPYTATMLENNEIKFVHLQDRLVITADGTIQQKELKRGVDDSTWTLTNSVFKNKPDYDFKKNYDDKTFTLDVAKIGKDRILTSSAALFNADYVGGRFVSIGSDLTIQNGVARITSFINDTSVKVDILSTFEEAFTTGGISGKNCYLGESAWNATHGYPKVCCYYEGRLYFANTPSLPSTLFGSVTWDPFNFDMGDGLDTDAIRVTINGFYIIENIVGDVTLQVYTDESEMATLQSGGAPLSPSNMSIRKQSGNGSENLTPAVLDNQTFYIKRGGKGIMSYIYNDSGTKYLSEEVSLLSPNLIVNPKSLAVYKGSREEEANYLFITNGNGTLVIYHTLKAQKISGMSLQDLSGQNAENMDQSCYKRAISVGDDIYFIISREIDGHKYLYLEQMNFSKTLDCSIEKILDPAGILVTGLDIFEGLVVKVFGDGYLLTDKTVRGGEIELEHSCTNVVIGLNYIPKIEPMPFDINLQNGNNMYDNKRITKITVQYYESLGILVDGKIVPYRQFGDTLNYVVPEPESGYFSFTEIKGWDPRQTFGITQLDPFPMTILNYAIKLGI